MDGIKSQNGQLCLPAVPSMDGGLDTEKGDEKLESTSNIDYLYLTFATPLPIPNTAESVSYEGLATEEKLLTGPNLAPYTNPIEWPSSRKYLMLFLSCVAAFLTAYTAGSYSPPHQLMREDLGASSNVGVLAGITTFCVGFGLAPVCQITPLADILDILSVSGASFRA